MKRTADKTLGESLKQPKLKRSNAFKFKKIKIGIWQFCADKETVWRAVKKIHASIPEFDIDITFGEIGSTLTVHSTGPVKTSHYLTCIKSAIH